MASAKILDWVVSTSYQVDEVVTVLAAEGAQYTNKMYRCETAHVSSSFTADFGNSLWEELIIKGTKGDTGDQGASGVAGATGAAGSNGANGATGANGIFSAIASKATAETGTENTEGMTALRTKEAIDFNLTADRAQVATNVVDIAQNELDISQNALDIAGIVDVSAQVATNVADIGGNAADIATNAADIAAIVIDNAQIAQNKADIATINTVDFPAVDDDVNALKARMAVVENATNLTFATGKQRVNNNQAVAEDILGSDAVAQDGFGNRFELNPVGAKSATVRVEIYRKDDAETRFTIAELELHFINLTWYIGRFKTLVLLGDDDGLTFSVTQDVNDVATVAYVSDNMVGGNYDTASYLKFELKEISNFT